jgi:hypothetical protein
MAASLSLYRDKEIDFAKNVKFWDSGRVEYLVSATFAQKTAILCRSLLHAIN